VSIAPARGGRERRAPTVQIVAILLSLAPPSAVLAQTAPSPIVPPERPDQATAPPPPTEAAPLPQQGTAGLREIQPFRLERVELSGSTLPAGAAQAAWAPFVGRTIDSQGLVAVTDAIVKAYERSDVALYTVLVPAQDFAGGVLRVSVLEGYVESVSVEGDGSSKTTALVRRYLDELQGKRPLTKPLLQRYVSLARDTPGSRTELQFLTGAAPGAVRIAAKVDSNPVQVALSANNRGTAFLGRAQVAADLYLNGLFGGSQSRLSVITPTETGRFRYLGLGHSQTLGESGATVQVNVGHLRTRPSGTDIRGKAVSAGMQVSYPLIRSFEEDLYLTAGLDGLNAESAFLGSTFSDDRSRAARFSVLYTRQSSRQRFSGSGAVSVGLNAFGARTSLPAFTELDFVKFNVRASFARQLAEKLVLRVSAAGQWTGDRLPAAEQFALGGNDFGRAYEAAALIGDVGYGASAELAYRPSGAPAILKDTEAYGFVDGGSVIYRRRAGFAAVPANLASAGLGVRATVREHIALQIEGATALSRTPSPAAGDERLIFGVRTVW
jgi:hemolysin activation/secretion protein